MERTKKPVSSVRYSVSSPGRTSPPAFSSGIGSPAVNRLETRVLRHHRVLHAAKESFRFGGVVRGVVADIHVDGHETVLGPGMDRQMRLGQENGARHPLRFELKEAIADDCHAGRLRKTQAQRTQRVHTRHLRHCGRAAIPFSEQMDAVHCCTPSPPWCVVFSSVNSILLPKISAWAIILMLSRERARFLNAASAFF